MSSYRVVNPFQAFERQYKRDAVLTDADLSCWEPEEDRDLVLKSLVTQGKIEAIPAEDSAAKYPATWGRKS